MSSKESNAPLESEKELEVFQNSQGPSTAMPEQHEQGEVPKEKRIEGRCSVVNWVWGIYSGKQSWGSEKGMSRSRRTSLKAVQ